MSAIDNSATASTITGTTTIDIPDYTGATTVAYPGAITYTGGSAYIDPVDRDAFIEEWKKLRKDFLGILLKENPNLVKAFKMTRDMQADKRTLVKIEIEYYPEVPKDKIRTTL